MGAPEVTAIVVSRGRPAALAACAAALLRQDHPAFEVVVVADPAGLAALPADPRLRALPFDVPNIGLARNAGLDAARAAAVAFLDDDAVAPPGWLSALVAALRRAAAATGPVREPGRTLGPREVRRDGATAEARAEGGLVRASPGARPRAEGTAMAFRAEPLRALGGFDPAFRFFHDETDLFWRWGEAGHALAWAPGGSLDHRLLASERRRRDRVALSLREVGASVAVWARRRGLDPGALLDAERAGRRRTLLRQMVAGRVEPGDVARLLRDLDAGAAEGLARPLGALPPRPAPTPA